MSLSHAEWEEQKLRELEDRHYELQETRRREQLQKRARHQRSKVEFKNWLLEKESKERAQQLLAKLGNERRRRREQWFEVAIALSAVDRLRGVGNLPPEERKKRKLLADDFYRWSKDPEHGHEFENVPVDQELARTFTANAQEIMSEYAEQLDRAGQYIIPSLKYSIPKVKQAAHDKRNLFNPDKIKYNKIFVRLLRQEWARANVEMEVRLDKLCARFSGLDADRAEARALGILGLNRMAKWVEEDEIEAKTIDENRQRENKEDAKREHSRFVAKKERFKVRLPDASEGADLDEVTRRRQKILFGAAGQAAKPAGRMNFAKADGVSVRVSRSKAANNSIDILNATGSLAGSRYAYCLNSGDLELARRKLLDEGHIYKENFKDEDGDDLHEEFLSARQSNSKKARMRQLLRQREEKAQEAFDAWRVQKALKEKAVEALEFVDKPGRAGQPPKVAEQHWRYVGEQLKAVDPTLLGAWVSWSEGFRTAGQCKSTWEALPPIVCDTCSPSSAVHNVLVTLLNRPGFDFKQAFDLAVERQLKKLMESDGRDADDATSEERQKVEESLQLNGRQFRKMMLDAGVKLRRHEVRILTTLFDENGDGLVSRKEFLGLTGQDPRPGARGETLLVLRNGNYCCWEAACHVTGMTTGYEVVELGAAEEDKNESDASEYATEFESDAEGTLARNLPVRLRSGKVKPGWFRLPLPGLEKRMRRLLLDGLRAKKDFATKPPQSCDLSRWTNKERADALDGLEALGAKNREESDKLALMQGGEKPMAPVLLAQSLGEDYISLTWRPGEGSVLPSFYVLETAGVEGSKTQRSHTYEEILRDPPSALARSQPVGKTTLKNLRPGLRYVFRIRAFNGFGPGPFAHASFVTRPPQPLLPVIRSLNPTSISLSWGGADSSIKTHARMLKDVFLGLDKTSRGAIDREDLLTELESRHSDLFAALDGIPSANIPGASILDMLEATGAGDAIKWQDVSGWLRAASAKASSVGEAAGESRPTTPGSASGGLRTVARQAFQYILCKCLSDEEVRFQKEGALQDGEAPFDTATRVMRGSHWFANRLVAEAAELPPLEYLELPEQAAVAREKPALRVLLGKGGRTRNRNADPESKQTSEPGPQVVGEFLEPVTHLEIYEQAYAGESSTATVKGLEPGRSYQFRLLARPLAGGEPSRMSQPLVVHTPELGPAPPRVGKSKVGTDTVTLQWGAAERAGRATTSATLADPMQTIDEWARDPNEDLVNGVGDATIRKMFNRYDRDASGFIEGSELCDLCTDLGIPSKGPRFEEAKEALDTNKDGKVSYFEFRRWWRSAQPVFLLLHRQIDHPSAKWRVVYRGDKTVATVSGLAPNHSHAFAVQVETAKGASARSRELVVETAPETPQQPVVIEADAKSARVKWYAGAQDRARFCLELLEVSSLGGDADDQGVARERSWRTVYKGTDTLALVRDLQPETVYRLRVAAVSTTGQKSSPSLPCQFETPGPHPSLKKQASRANAASYFKIECTGDVVVGDTILFTERVFANVVNEGKPQRTPGKAPMAKFAGPSTSLSQQSLSTLDRREQGKEFLTERTVAARCLALAPSKRGQGTTLSLEVLWSSVARSTSPASCQLPEGSRIQRLDRDLYRFETFRAAWLQESSRWSSSEEQEAALSKQ